jgi:hypothetical protein
VPRWLRLLLLAFTVLATMNVPAILAGAVTSLVDDGCEHGGCQGEGCHEGEEGAGCPDDGGACPPSCHGCLCRPHVGAPTGRVALASNLAPPALLVAAPPLSLRQAPPPRGVFHPPRRSS